MTYDLVPAELLASALTAVLLAVPLSFALAAAAITGPRRAWNSAGLAMGLGLLVGVLVVVLRMVTGPSVSGALPVVSGVLVVLGLLAAAVAVVLVFVLEDGTTWSSGIGIGSSLLIGLGAPGDALPELLGLTSSILAIGAAVVFEGVALAAIVGFLVMASGRVRGLQFGVAAAGIVAALLTAGRTVLHALHVLSGLDVPELSLLSTLIAALVALGVGSVVGELVEMWKSRRRSSNALETS